ncbi:hypothetical protein LCGC14_2365840, partial [marine sediment metagenome]
FLPSLVILIKNDATTTYWFCIASITLRISGDAASTTPTDLVLHGSDGFVVDRITANVDPNVFYWWAISE